MRIFVAFLALLILGACSSVETPPAERSLQEQIAKVEEAVANTPTKVLREQLIGLYKQELQDSTLDQTTRLNRYRFMAESAYSDGNHVEAYDLLRVGVTDNPKAATVAEAGMLLAELANARLREPYTTDVIFATLRSRFAGQKILEVIPKEHPVLDLDSLRKAKQQEIYGLKGFDKDAAITYGKGALAYTALIGDEELAIADHIASGRVLEQAKQFKLAIKHYDEVMRRAPRHESAKDAAFLKGFICFEYQDRAMGRELIEEFIAKYPDHRLTAGAITMLAESKD